MTTATKNKLVFTLVETKMSKLLRCYHWDGDENSKPFHGTFPNKQQAITAMENFGFEIREDEK